MRYHEIAERVLAASRASGTMVLLTSTSSASTRWARNELTTNGDTETADITVIAIHDDRDGRRVAAVTRPATNVDPAAIADEALDQARRSAPAWDAQPLPELTGAPAGSWASPAAAAGADDLWPALDALGSQIASDAAEHREHFGYLELSASSHWLATSSGLALRFDQPEARVELTVKSHGRTRSTWQGHAGPRLDAVAIAAMAERARTELTWQARSVDVAPGHRTAILSPSATADLMIDLLYGADARSAVQGRSAFSRTEGATAIGEALSDRRLRLWSDPAMPAQHSMPFLFTAMSHDAASVFDNGLALDACDWIREGRLAALVSSRAVAAEAALPLALAPDNLALDAAGDGTLDDLIARTGDGLLVTCTWYNRMVDPAELLITGLTRDGVYVVRDGEVIGQAGNFRFNESPVRMLARITDASSPAPALGREMADYFPRTTMPALVVSEFNLTSASEAV